MLTKSKRMIYSTHDQFSNVIYKAQNFYQHHYYHNDLIYRCNNTKTKQNKRYKRKKRNGKRRTKRNTRIKYISGSENSIKNYSNSFNRNDSNSVTINKVCYCASKVNVKASYQYNNYNLRHIYVYFQKQYSNFQLVLVIILLALIMCTAQSVDTQEKPHQKSTTSPTLAAANDAGPMAAKYFNESSLHTIACQNHVPNATTLRGKQNICPNLRHLYHRYLKGQSNQQLNTHKTFKNQNSSNNLRTKFKTSLHNQQNPTQIHYQLDNDNNNKDDDGGGNYHYSYHNDSAFVINKRQQSYKNVNEIKNKIMTKEDQREINNSNINKFFKHIRTNKYNSDKNDYDYNKTANMIKHNIENTNDNIVDHIDKYENDFKEHDYSLDVKDNNDRVKIKNFHSPLRNLLPPANNYSIQYIHNQQQNIDHLKLMKLVMDGLGIKQIPKMETINISQEEYISKYREYFQRVHKRKRRNIQNDQSIIRPLEIYSIAINNTLLNLHQDYKILYKPRFSARKKRSPLELNNDESHDDQQSDLVDDRKQSLEDRVRNILLLKKKYQKPRSTKKDRDERKTNIHLMFALKPEILNLSSSDIEEANIRLVLIHSPILAIRNSKNKKTHSKPKSNSCGSKKSESPKSIHPPNVLNLKLFFISKHGKRVLLDGRKMNINVDLTKPDETHTQWLQFDVSKAVKTAIDDKRLQHVVLELQCDNCKRLGARILNDAYNTAADALAHEAITEGHQLMPVLNIIGHFDQSQRSMRPHKYESHHSDTSQEATTPRHYHHQTYSNNKNRYNRRTNCYKANQRCCRHSMEVTFKEIKGFEFIIQPKVFDAGYCHGRCPPRYNPAHHHALLQSLIWKQNHQKAPRPCCAPSKLVELEVLHVDEKDSEKLKISTWSDMKVVECACS